MPYLGDERYPLEFQVAEGGQSARWRELKRAVECLRVAECQGGEVGQGLAYDCKVLGGEVLQGKAQR